MNKLALVFVGQGSQYPNMSLDFLEIDKNHEKNLKIASDILGYNVAEVLSANDERIHDTLYTQPLIMLASIINYHEFLKLDVKIDAVLGFSLGEYTAFYASNIFNYEDSIKLIEKRAQFMKNCAINNKGKMAAILGLSKEEVEEICKISSTDQIVVPANYNSANQIVISGNVDAVNKAMMLAKEKGAKRALELSVSGAFHSPLMKDAGNKLREYLNEISYKNPTIPIYMNSTANRLNHINLYNEMEAQIQSPVLFEQSIIQMIEDGITHFIEIGPGTVLSGLIKKIDINSQVNHLDKLSDLEQLKGWLVEHGFKK
jgi:[acyl-carrier-protein] S-malonyltransferase